MGFFDELKDKAEEFGDKAQDRADKAQEGPTEDAGQDIGDFAPVGATEPEVAAVEDETAQTSAASAGEATGPTEPAAQPDENASSAASDADQGVGEFAPVGATEPDVSAVENETAEASAASTGEATEPVDSP